MPKSSISEEVIGVISTVSGFDVDDITPASRLLPDLKMTGAMRRSLAPDFEDIAQKTNSAARIFKTECESLKTVEGAIKLVTQRATPPKPKKAKKHA